MTHTCDVCGLEHQVDEPTDVVEEVVAADAAVSIAEIEAERDVTLAKINAGNEKVWQEGRVAELEGQLLGMKEILDRLNAPPPEPEPVPVVVAPEPEPLAEQELGIPWVQPRHR